jgi:hypothetical protein
MAGRRHLLTTAPGLIVRPGAVAAPAPSYLTLPWTRHFDDDTIDTAGASIVDDVVVPLGWGGLRGGVLVKSVLIPPGQLALPNHSKSLRLYGDKDNNTGSGAKLPLGAAIDASAGVRWCWYVGSENAHAGNDSAKSYGAILYADDASNTAIRMYHDGTTDQARFYAWVDGVTKADVSTNTWNNVVLPRWYLLRCEANFAAGSVIMSGIRDGDWATQEYTTLNFTAFAGPTKLDTVGFTNAGSASGWAPAYGPQHIGQVWIGALTDAWPTAGAKWTV